MTIDFTAFPKIPRLASPFIVTEKLDGSNAAVLIVPWSELVEEVSKGWNWGEEYYRTWGSQRDNLLTIVGTPIHREYGGHHWVEYRQDAFAVFAQSRNRFITPERDNFGFASWVRDNAEILVEKLGPGRHFGEWWGHGIQRGYGLARGDRRFSLFNVTRHEGLSVPEIGLGVVPVLTGDTCDTDLPAQGWYMRCALEALSDFGSYAAPGFMNPEGVILFHARSKQMFKQYLDPTEKADEVSKRESGVLAA